MPNLFLHCFHFCGHTLGTQTQHHGSYEFAECHSQYFSVMCHHDLHMACDSLYLHIYIYTVQYENIHTSIYIYYYVIISNQYILLAYMIH